ncbi:MAG: hypothetical protein JSV56_09230 [Methanomassiliicoccales archaeon]|nr:MAG: hypothetical protein JSV56_09230 [Methanomassiliicoccales archaeon]
MVRKDTNRPIDDIMSSLKEYKKYRKVGLKLNHKIMDAHLERDVLMKSARLLGIARGDVLLFDTEDETSVLMDFALNDIKVKNKNIVEIYREKIGWKNMVEKEILDARRSSYTSLFSPILERF